MPSEELVFAITDEIKNTSIDAYIDEVSEEPTTFDAMNIVAKGGKGKRTYDKIDGVWVGNKLGSVDGSTDGASEDMEGAFVGEKDGTFVGF